MRVFRRSLIALAVAATLPTVLFAAVGIFYFLRSARANVERTTLAHAGTVVYLSDAALRGDLRALNILTSSVYFDSGNWAEFQPRIKRVLAANPQWLTIRVFDPQHGTEILDAARPLGAPHPVTTFGTQTLESLRRLSEPTVGGVAVETEPVLYIYAPVMRDDRTPYVLLAAVRTQVLQDLLVSQIEPDTVAALVDRNGNFIARTVDYAGRVAQPATHFVRDAMQKRSSGFYRGTTYEGFKNYSAFRTSAWSGLSAHVAVASSLVDRPTALSFVVAGTAGLGGLLLAGILITLVLRDMAERRQSDEALRQSQKMEAVGQLTGGIAHDFNNLLTAVIGNLDMIRTRAADNPRLAGLADNALEAARRGAKLTSQLLAFSRSQRMHLTTVDLDELLNGMSALLRQSVGPAIALRVEIAAGARFVSSDSNQLELALLNLAVNARDAMPSGGVLTISTLPAIDLDLRDLPRRPYVEIRVQDTGNGMSEAVLSRAVEPFFTTKGVGEGTGLGLSQVYGVTRESGGKLLIESIVGSGTVIHLVLPRASIPAPAARKTGTHTPTIPVAPAEAPKKSVLLVDDDRQVRRFVADSLRTLGYQVVAVAGGSEALEKLRADSFDILVVDFAMPGMNGAEVARSAQQLQPALQVLMVSGYADSAVIKSALGDILLLRKPFDSEELGAAMRDLLRRTEAQS